MISLLKLISELEINEPTITWKKVEDLINSFPMNEFDGMKMQDQNGWVNSLNNNGIVWSDEDYAGMTFQDKLKKLDKGQLGNIYKDISDIISKYRQINELEINNPSRPTNNEQLLDFLNKNKTKEKVLTYLENSSDISFLTDEGTDYELEKFELDSSGNPSIGDGYNYCSFSLNEEELSTENDNSEVEILDMFNFPIYYISYSI